MERERLARLAAEAEAEKGLRALYETQREAELMRAIAMAANQEEFVGQALERSLHHMGGYAGAAAGTAWLCPEGTGVLVATGIWHLADLGRATTLRGTIDATWLRRGDDLPGRVLATGQPAWITDAGGDRSGWHHLAAVPGIRAAFALPLLIDTTVAGVLEFFFTTPRPADERLLALARDIGTQLGRVIERHRAKMALARARDELEERSADLERVNRELRREIAERDAADAANRAKSEFLANMSHEIRTPMTAVLGYADLLLDADVSPDDRLQHVLTIRRNGEHLLAILNDLLDLSKIEAGEMTVERIACSPATVLTDAVSLLRVRALEKGLSLDVEFATPLPEVIESDPTRLRQILVNLIGNAIKFTSSGTIRVIARLDRAGAGARLSFAVADPGIGMSPAQLDRLFRPFSQADSSTTRRFGGSGLGLAISRRLAEMLGATLEVESELERGSTFTLAVALSTLDGVRMVDAPSEAAQSLAHERAVDPPRFPGRILLAEDGRDNQLLIATILRDGGAQVTIVDNGRAAVDEALRALADGTPYDVILMDMQMPELDGYGATANLRARGYTRPIVALTAHALSTDRDRAIHAGCDDYLVKPVDRAHFSATVKRFIDAEAEALGSTLEDDAEMVPIIRRFVENLSERAAALREAAAHADLATLERLAHQLKGAAAGYGFAPIGAAAAALEVAIRDARGPATIHSCVTKLAGLCQRARAPRLVALVGGSS